MEEKLESYRIRKRRRQTFEGFKKKLLRLMPFQQQEQSQKEDDIKINITDEDHDVPGRNNNNENRRNEKLLQEQQSIETLSSTTSENSEESELVSGSEEIEKEDTAEILTPDNVYLKYFLWLLYFSFWATCYAIAIELKFGTVYLVISALFGIYFNTRTGPKQDGEISAYSVFNENCRSIDGTLKGEQFEQELRFGAMGVSQASTYMVQTF